MKKFLFIILLLSLVVPVTVAGNLDSGMKFSVPADFRVDTLSGKNFMVSGDSAVAFIDFISIPNIDKKKATAAPDSAFLKIAAYQPLESGIEGNADVITKYYDPDGKRYVKIYRFVHSDGITNITAFNHVDDFEWADTIDSSYHKGLRWYWWVFLIVGGLIMGFAAMNVAINFNKNWPRFIVSLLVVLAFLIPAIIFGAGTVCLIVILLFLIIGIADRMGYTIIPV